MALTQGPRLRATILLIITSLCTKAVAPGVIEPPAPVLPPSSHPPSPSPVWGPMRMCFWEPHSTTCDAKHRPALCCTKLRNGECCGHDEDDWCGSMSGEGILQDNIVHFYKTSRGVDPGNACRPMRSYSACCSYPGSCVAEGQELERCSIRYMQGAPDRVGFPAARLLEVTVRRTSVHSQTSLITMIQG